jgi:hypothetical protein
MAGPREQNPLAPARSAAGRCLSLSNVATTRPSAVRRGYAESPAGHPLVACVRSRCRSGRRVGAPAYRRR